MCRSWDTSDTPGEGVVRRPIWVVEPLLRSLKGLDLSGGSWLIAGGESTGSRVRALVERSATLVWLCARPFSRGRKISTSPFGHHWSRRQIAFVE